MAGVRTETSAKSPTQVRSRRCRSGYSPSRSGSRIVGAIDIDRRACQARRARICSQFTQWLWFPTLISADRTPEFAAGLAKTQAALAYAGRLHDGQFRTADGAPFIVHPIEVGMLLYESGAPDDVIAAGVLHDTLEKTDATAYDIYARFGRRVGDIVCAVSHDPAIAGYTRRKAALREQVANAGEDALTVFAADKLSKVRELQLGDSSGTKVRTRKLRHYRLSLAMLQERLPDSSLVGALAAELDAPSDAAGLSARSE
jgi:HD domain